jgi:predicted ArsR family transcriptional regulator
MSGTLRATLPLAVDGEPSFRGFAPTKRAILMHLKRGGEADLATLARSLSISKMAVYKHVQELEESGLVERDVRRGGVGRPRLILRLAPEASSLFPKAYASVTCALLKYIEETMGRKAVEAAHRSRHKQIHPQYQEGYMAEMREGRRGQFELFEYNCPIVAIAQDYWEACTVENELFRKVLRADVETTHRVVAGDHVCRFLIKPRAKGVSP